MTQTRPSHSRRTRQPPSYRAATRSRSVVAPRTGWALSSARAGPATDGGDSARFAPPPSRRVPNRHGCGRRTASPTVVRRRGPAGGATPGGPVVTWRRARLRGARGPMSSRSRTRIIVPVVAVIAVIAVVIGAWAVDSSRQSGRTARGLTIAGRPVGGLTESELRAATADLAADYDGAWVSIASPAGELDTTAAGVGLGLDQEAIVQAALAVDRATAPSSGRSRGCGRSSPAATSPAVRRRSRGADHRHHRARRRQPGRTDRTHHRHHGRRGHGGRRHRRRRHRSRRPRRERWWMRPTPASRPSVVTADPAPTPPRFSDTDAQAVADQATAATATPLALEIGGKSATVVSDTLRSWVTVVPGPTALELQADQAKIVADLPTLVTDLGVAPVPVSFNVVPDGDNPFGKVEDLVDGQLGVECCAPDSAQRIAAALVAGQHTAALDLWPVGPEHDKKWAESLGIVQPISPASPPPTPRASRGRRRRIAGMTPGRRSARRRRSRSIQRSASGRREGLRRGRGDHGRRARRPASAGSIPVRDDDVQRCVLRLDDSTKGRGVGGSQTEIIRGGHGGEDHRARRPVALGGILCTRRPTGSRLDVLHRHQRDGTFYSTPWVTGEQTGQTTEPKGPASVHHRADPHLGRRPHRR